MTEPLFQPRLREDGSLDPEPLERMGLDWLTGWMRERLSGLDPWFPIDRRSDEDPDLLIVGLLRRIGSGHPLAALLGSVARRLLEEASAESSYFRSLLRLCQQVALPATSPWFTAQLERLSRSSEDFTDLTNEILFAALRQAPGWPGSLSRPYWEKLLLLPQSATLALASFGTSLEQQASHLAAWWRVCPREERDLELSQLIFGALTIEGEEVVRAVLGKTSSLPSDLRQAIDRELLANGKRPLFSQASRHSSLRREIWKNSGQRRDIVLKDVA